MFRVCSNCLAREMPWTLDEEYAEKQPEMEERAVWLRVIALCLQQLSDKGDAMNSEKEYLEKQQEAEDRAAPVTVPPPVQLRCTLVVSNEGATAVLQLSYCGSAMPSVPDCWVPCESGMPRACRNAFLHPSKVCLCTKHSAW